jgi:hypothetical protein
MRFRDYLLNEGRAYLGQRIGDVLNGLEDLDSNGKSMGMRQVMRSVEGVINQIRRILHSNWPKTEERTLKKLQKIGVALARALDPERKKEENDDIYAIISGAKNELEQLSGKIGEPVNEPQKDEDQPEEEDEQLQPMPPMQQPPAQPPAQAQQPAGLPM